jgi:hypothetical protein
MRGREGEGVVSADRLQLLTSAHAALLRLPADSSARKRLVPWLGESCARVAKAAVENRPALVEQVLMQLNVALAEEAEALERKTTAIGKAARAELSKAQREAQDARRTANGYDPELLEQLRKAAHAADVAPLQSVAPSFKAGIVKMGLAARREVFGTSDIIAKADDGARPPPPPEKRPTPLEETRELVRRANRPVEVPPVDRTHTNGVVH